MRPADCWRPSWPKEPEKNSEEAVAIEAEVLEDFEVESEDPPDADDDDTDSDTDETEGDSPPDDTDGEEAP